MEKTIKRIEPKLPGAKFDEIQKERVKLLSQKNFRISLKQIGL